MDSFIIEHIFGVLISGIGGLFVSVFLVLKMGIGIYMKVQDERKQDAKEFVKMMLKKVDQLNEGINNANTEHKVQGEQIDNLGKKVDEGFERIDKRLESKTKEIDSNTKDIAVLKSKGK